MQLPQLVNTYGHYLKKKYGHHVHKITVNAQFDCPNRNGEKGSGGCIFCNNDAFSPESTTQSSLEEQISCGIQEIKKRRNTDCFVVYFQAYTNTYAEAQILDTLYRRVMNYHGVIGISVGTRPDCVHPDVLEILARIKSEGHEVCLELGLQSGHDSTLDNINRHHTFEDYRETLTLALSLGLDTCTHLILGLPGETLDDYLITLEKVVSAGSAGIKLHPLHVVKGTELQRLWQEGKYTPLSLEEYVHAVGEIVRHSPPELIFHRLTAHARGDLLLAPDWCSGRWSVLNAIARDLAENGKQGYYCVD